MSITFYLRQNVLYNRYIPAAPASEFTSTFNHSERREKVIDVFGHKENLREGGIQARAALIPGARAAGWKPPEPASSLPSGR